MIPRMLRALGKASLRSLWCFAVGLIASTAVAEATPEELADLESKASFAYFTEDANTLRNLLRANGGWAKAEATAELYQYAHLNFRLLQLAVRAGRREEADRAGAACLDALNRATAGTPRFAEGLALASACHGYLAEVGGYRLLLHTPKSITSIDAALAIDPRNPRVLLIDGCGLQFRAASLGGDRKRALARFEQASRAFAAEAMPLPGAPSWGAAETWVFIGLAREQGGDVVAARTAYEQALLLAPDFRRAQAGLARVLGH